MRSRTSLIANISTPLIAMHIVSHALPMSSILLSPISCLLSCTSHPWKPLQWSGNSTQASPEIAFLMDLSAVWTLAVKIQASGQHIAYFEHLQAECGIAIPLSIPLHSNVHWGTADGMLGRAYRLCQPINLFINSADELFGPITTIWRAGLPAKQIPWTTFSFKASDWERINDICTIVADANNIQQYFSHELWPTLWRMIPTFEELQMGWETKHDSPRYMLYKNAINCSLSKIGKYYSKFNEKPAYILALGMFILLI